MTGRDRNQWEELIRSLKPSDIHRHMDGSLRPKTLWDLSERYYSAIPGMDFQGFERMLRYDPESHMALIKAF